MGRSRQGVEHPLVELANRMDGLEVVAGVRLERPTFQRRGDWAGRSIGDVQVPAVFHEFVRNVGEVAAVDVAGGVEFLSFAASCDHSNQEYGRLLTQVDGVGAFPFATNGAGEFLLLAADDTGVWKFNVYMHPVARPRKLARSFDEFLRSLQRDWEAVLAGRGGPYSTS